MTISRDMCCGVLLYTKMLINMQHSANHEQMLYKLFKYWISDLIGRMDHSGYDNQSGHTCRFLSRTDMQRDYEFFENME